MLALRSVFLPSGECRIERRPLRGHPNMAIVAQHTSGNVARNLHDRFVARTAFGKFRD